MTTTGLTVSEVQVVVSLAREKERAETLLRSRPKGERRGHQRYVCGNQPGKIVRTQCMGVI